MFDVLLNLQITALPIAFLAMLVAGGKLYQLTRRKSAAFFAFGMLLLLLSQLVLFISYRVWPAIFDPTVGIVSSAPREAAFMISTGLSIIGLLLSAASLLYFAWFGRGIEAQPGVQADPPK